MDHTTRMRTATADVGEASGAGERRTGRIGTWWTAQPVWFQWGTPLIALRIALRVWVSIGAYFHMDDWFYLVDSSQQDFGSYITQIYNGHLMPLGFSVVWILQSMWPAEWGAAAAFVIAMDTLAIVFFVLLLRRAFRPSRWLLVPLAVGLFAPMWATTAVWYASALQMVPLTAALYATVYYLVIHHQTGRYRWLVLSVIAYGIGLAFWEKTLLVTIVVAFVSVGFFTDGRLLRRVRSAWAVLLAFALASLAYIGVYVSALAGQEPLDDSPSLSDFGSVAYTGVVEVLIPTLFGGTWNAPSGGVVGVPDPAPWWASMLMLEAALAVVVATILRHRVRAVWAWSMMVVYVTVDIALLSLARFDFFGSLLARDPRYVEDAAPVFALALALATTAVVRGVSGDGTGSPATAALPRLVSQPTTLILCGVLVLNSCLLTTSLIAQMWRQSAAKSFWGNFQSDVMPLGPVSLIDRKVPEDVMAGLFLERAETSYISQAFELPLQWNAPADRLYVVQDDGHVSRAVLPSPAKSLAGPDGPCGYGVKASSRYIPLDNTLFDWDWVVRMSYLASDDTSVRVSMGDERVDVPLSQGPGEVWFVVQGQGSRVLVEPPTNGQGVCVAGLDVGIAAAGP